MNNVRQRMIEDMKLRALAPRTRDRHLHAIKALAEHYRRPPDKITQEQVRKYLLYFIETKGCAKSTFNVDLAAIEFMYRRTLGRDWSLLKIRGSSAISTNCVQQCLKATLRQSNILKNVNCHTLRHSYHSCCSRMSCGHLRACIRKRSTVC